MATWNGLNGNILKKRHNGVWVAMNATSTTPPPGSTAPTAPTNAVATAGDGQIIVTFDAPTSNGGTPITSYTAAAGSSSATVNGPTPQPITITGLTNGTLHFITVTATNAVGTGPAANIPALLIPSANADDLIFTYVGTHPQAAAQTTVQGKRIDRLTAFNNKLYIGYGDYTNNTGPIIINAYDPSVSAFTGSLASVPTEAIKNFREINGKLYAPTIDPIGGESKGGYAVGEPWSTKLPVDAIHMYDMCTFDGSDLWMFGGQDYAATAWRSTDNGVSWTIMQTSTPSGGDFGRYYWGAVLNGSLYMQSDPLNSATNAAVQIYDGTTWTTGTTTSIAGSDEQPVVFAGNIITKRNGLSAFDGTTLTKVNSFTRSAEDLCVHGGYLYVLDYNSVISRTTDLITWETVCGAPSNATTIAILNDRIYIGSIDSKLYESSLMQ